MTARYPISILLLVNIAAALLSGQTQDRADVHLLVPATANPYLAGMPTGTRARVGDRAPQQSPVLVEISLDRATAVSFRASGAVDHTPNCPPGCYPPDGSSLTGHQGGAEHGIAAVLAPINSLVGVFLDDQRPDRSLHPGALNFQRIGMDFGSLSPHLKQVFFVGTGITRKGTVRRFLVPQGATRLYLGIMDAFEWNNNTGSFSVTVSVERSNVASGVFSVDSSVSFAKWACLPDRSQCTPEREIVEPKAPGQYHIILPAHLEWGASIPNADEAAVAVSAAKGTVCLDAQSRSTSSCTGPEGSGQRADESFLAPGRGVGALVIKTVGGQTYFSINGHSGAAFRRHEGYFEFDVTIR